jgi:uncharacterized protein YrrD
MLGRAKDVYVDAQLDQLAGLYLGSEGMIRRKAQVIPSADVVLFGIDVVLVKATDVITDDKALATAADWYRLKDLQGYEVHTPGGTKLGTVGDVILDESGAIVGLSLSRVFVKGPLAEQGTVQREVIVETAHDEEIIRVDLAMLEGLAVSEEEGESAAEITVEETAEEIIVEEVQDEGEEAVPDSEDSSIVEEPAQEAHAADAPQEAAEEQE